MPKDSPIPPMGDAWLEWRNKYPTAADELIRTVNLLSSLELSIATPASYTAAGKQALVKSDSNFVLRIPIRFAAPIADSDATAASASATINAVLAQLRLSGILPSA